MRTRRVVTQRVCNQRCGFCTARRSSDDPAAVAHDAIAREIEQATEAPLEELVLTGGEPTLRSDLARLIARARARGAARVVLETNATRIDRARAETLREAGLGTARVHVPALGRALAEITGDPLAEAALDRGLEALAAAGIAIEIAVPIVRASLAHVAAIPAGLADRIGAERVRAIVVHVPVDSPDPAALVGYEDAVPAILALAAAARAVGVAIRLAPDSGPPPCAFPAGRRPTHLYSLAGRAPASDRHVKPEACASCRVEAACPGFPRSYLARRALPPIEPITVERDRRRLSLISSVEEQVARELVAPGGRGGGHGEPDETIVRVSFHCNQACDFCFVSTHLPAPAEDRVRAAIEEALAAGHQIALSGGEPTLHPRLPDYLRLASRSPWPVELQTNAIRLSDPALARTLHEAGLRVALVSLHGARAETGDRVTRAPGTFERTLRGIDNLRALGVRVTLNYVICGSNAAELPEMVAMVASRWPGVAVHVSFVARSTDVVSRDPDLMPRYTDVVPSIAAAIEAGERLGVPIAGFGSMCSVPLCLVPQSAERHFRLPENADGGAEFHKPAPCERCSLRTRCYGLRRGYVELHGDGELRPVLA